MDPLDIAADGHLSKPERACLAKGGCGPADADEVIVDRALIQRALHDPQTAALKFGSALREFWAHAGVEALTPGHELVVRQIGRRATPESMGMDVEETQALLDIVGRLGGYYDGDDRPVARAYRLLQRTLEALRGAHPDMGSAEHPGGLQEP